MRDSAYLRKVSAQTRRHAKIAIHAARKFGLTSAPENIYFHMNGKLYCDDIFLKTKTFFALKKNLEGLI